VRQLLMAHTGARWSFISFPAAGERLAALLGGHVDFVLVEPPEAGELIRAGKLRALVQIADKRLAGFETVPTLPEAGFKVPNVPQARGIVGPPGMPADAVAYYEELLRKTSRSPGWQKFLHDNQLDDAFLNSKDTIAFLGEFEQQLRDILIQSGVKLVREELPQARPRHGRACPGHPRLRCGPKRRGCPRREIYAACASLAASAGMTLRGCPISKATRRRACP